MHKHLKRDKHRGVTLVFAALWMGIALAALMVLDIGNLVWQKRELQKIADLSALAGATGSINEECTEANGSAAKFVAEKNGWESSGKDQLVVRRGLWKPQGADNLYFFDEGAVNNANACHVKIVRSVPYFFMWATDAKNRKISAEATAARKASRLAQLSVRSQLLQLASANSPLLNTLVGGLLGGNLNLDVMSWKGLAGVDLQLLDFLDALKIDLGLNAGGYEQLLNTNLGVGQLLEVAAEVLSKQGDTAGVALSALNKIGNLATGVPSLQLKLAEILGVDAAGADAALNTEVNLLELVMATVQAGNGNSALSGAVNIPLGIANVGLALKVIEPPQMSLAKDPELARQDPYGENKIFVRTAQTRILLSVDLPVLNLATGVLDTVLAVLSPLLNLVSGILGGITNVGEYMVIKVLPSPLRLDIGVDIASGNGYLTDYQCDAGDKKVEVESTSSAINLRLGRWGSNIQQAQSNAFSIHSLEKIKPVPVLRMDCVGCDGWVQKNGILQKAVTEQYFGGLGLMLDVPVLASTEKMEIDVPEGNAFSEPVSGSQPPNIVASLGPTVSGLKALSKLPSDPRASPAGLQGLLNMLSDFLSAVLGIVNTLIVTVLAPLLDPILNGVLALLGADLADAGVSARLTCDGGAAQLVY